MRKSQRLLVVRGLSTPISAQTPGSSQGWLSALTSPKDYVLKRSSSYDRTGGNEDSRRVDPGETLTLLDEPGPGVVSHIWITIASGERYHLKKLVLRLTC